MGLQDSRVAVGAAIAWHRKDEAKILAEIIQTGEMMLYISTTKLSLLWLPLAVEQEHMSPAAD